MQDTNICVEVGRFVRDPEMKFTTSGLAICNFDIANNKGKDKNGQDKGASFFNCVCFGKTAETVSKYCSKGKKVLVEGGLDQNRWTDKEGKNRSRVQIVANRVTFLDGGQRKESGPPTDQGGPAPEFYDETKGEAPAQPKTQTRQEQGGQGGSKNESGDVPPPEEAPPQDDDDIPF